MQRPPNIHYAIDINKMMNFVVIESGDSFNFFSMQNPHATSVCMWAEAPTSNSILDGDPNP